MGTKQQTIVEVESGMRTSPGQQFHDVAVTIERRGAMWRIQIVEQSGSNQGRLEVHRRKEVVKRDSDWKIALRRAESAAREIGMEIEYLVQALSEAADKMYDALETDEPKTD